MRFFSPRASLLPTAALSAAAGAAFDILFSRNSDFGAGEPPFIHAMSDLLGPPLLPGNAVTLLQNGAEIFPRAGAHRAAREW